MPLVDTNEQKKKEGDHTGDQTTVNSQKTDERMRSDVDDANKSWWKIIADKQAANLPKLAVDGPLDSTPTRLNTPTDATAVPVNVKNPTDSGPVLPTTSDAATQPVPTTSDAATQPAPPKLDAETVKKYADELHEAINKDSNGFLGIGSGNDPDNKKITDLLDSLTPTDRKAIEAAYVNVDKNSDHRSLRTELKDNLDGDDWRKTEAILNRRDGRTNDAGNLMVALSAINDDRGDAERRVLETFSTLNSVQQKQLETDFKQDYGMTVDEALKKYDVSGDAMKAAGFLRKPVEERTAKDIEDFAHFAIDKKNLDYFGIALRGDTPAAKEARDTLSKDDDFKKQISDAFKVHKDGGALGFVKNIVSSIPGGDLLVGGVNLVEGIAKGDLDFDRLTEGTTIDKLRSAVSSKEVDSKLLQAMDILHSGHVSLATIAADNTGSIFGWFDNKKAIGNAADNATDGEKQLFSKGYEISKNGGNATTDEDKNALNFYNDIHKAFNDADGGKDSAKWEDKLLNGKDGSIISAIADGDGQNGRFAAVEALSKDDWTKLKDAKTGPAFRKEIEEYVGKFTDKDETSKLLDLIDKKVAADTYEDSQKINRSLFDVIQQNKGHDFLFIGTDYNGKNVTAAIAGLSADESTKYKNDSGFRSDVDKFVNDNLDGAEKSYAKRLLGQVAETGKPPEQDAVSKLLSDKVNGVEAKDAIGDVEAALKDDKLRQKLSNNNDLTDEEKQVKSVIDGYVQQSLIAKFGPAVSDGGVQAHQQEYLKTLYDTGRLSVEQKAELGLRTKDFFIDAATASPEERQKLYDSKLVNDDDKKLIDTLVKEGGKMDLADEIRSFVLKDGTDVESFADKLKGLTAEQKQSLRDEYTKKFGSTIDDDLLSRVDESDRNNFRTYLTAGNVDGRQDFYDNLEHALKSESGFSPDGSQEVLDRSLTDQASLLSDFQSKFEQLPADKQEQANKYFSEALKDYQTSKEEFAEKLYQVAVIVGGIAVGVATGGVGLAALATVAVVGAVGRVALKKAIEGNDYDLSLSNVLKDGAIGAITAGASVIGPETIGAFAGVGTVAAERFAATAGEQLVEQGLKQGGKEIIEKESTNLIAHAVVRGEPITEQAINQVIDKAAADGITQTQRTALESALKTSIEDSGRTVSEQAIKSTLSGTARQAAAFGTIGGTANVLIEGTVGLANGNLDISNLPKAFATGFAVGSTLSVGFEAVSRGAAHFKAGDAGAPAGTSEHVDLKFTKNADGSLNVVAPEGKEVDLTVTHGGKDEVIHVDSKGTKLPDGVENVGIKDADISSRAVALESPTDAPTPVQSGEQIPSQNEQGLVSKFKRWFRGTPSAASGAEPLEMPLRFDRLQDARIRIDGEDIPVNNGNITIHRSNSGENPLVSRNQGQLRWNQGDHSFYYTDTSTNGTFVKQGDQFVRLPKGQEVKLDPNQEVRLGTPSGPKLEFFDLNQNGPIANVDKQIYVNGKATQFDNGRIEVGRNYQQFSTNDVSTNRVSGNHGSLSTDPETGRIVYTDHSKNGSFIKHANGQVEAVYNRSVFLNSSDEVHLGFQDGPVVKLQETPGKALTDGSVLYRRSEGDWIIKPDGTKVLDDRAGVRTMYDAQGKLTQADAAYGATRYFHYNNSGAFDGVKFTDGSNWTTRDGANWEFTDAKGNKSTLAGKLEADENGALRFTDSTGKTSVHNLDGSQEIHFPGRQIEYKDANYPIEKQRLESLASFNFPDQAQLYRFDTMLHNFEARGLPPVEVAETYRQLNRLLSASDSAKLGPFERAKLSEQILFEAAHPELIDQGANSTCNVATLETRAFTRNPSSAARMITDVALTGKYTTPEGALIDVERTGALKPDNESLRALQTPFKNGTYDDVKTDGSRSFAGQIFEDTAVNLHYADYSAPSSFNKAPNPAKGLPGYTYQPGDVIQYVKTSGAPGSKDVEQLFAFRSGADNHIEKIPLSDSPYLTGSDLQDIYNRIVPGIDRNGAPITGTESGFIVAGPSPKFRGDRNVVGVSSPAELQAVILKAKADNNLPLVLGVDTRDSLFGNTQDFGGTGGGHVISIKDGYWTTGANGQPEFKVEYLNQWGMNQNRLGANAVPVDQLFKATLVRDEQGYIDPFDLQFYPPNFPPPARPAAVTAPIIFQPPYQTNFSPSATSNFSPARPPATPGFPVPIRTTAQDQRPTSN